MVAKHEKFCVRVMARNEVDWALEAAAKEGWNPGLRDADAFYAADPQGVFIGTLNDQPIACLSAVAYGKNFGFIGLYIVDPKYRHQGYGWKIWQEGMKYLQGRCIGLDGVVEQQENYKKSGFKLSHRNVRYEGVAPRQLSDVRTLPPITPHEVKKIISWDAKNFGAERASFLRVWLTSLDQFNAYLEKDGEVTGYAVARKCRFGFKIGPLFADSYADAEMLLINLLTRIPGEAFFLDVPEINGSACKLAESYGMRVVFETARMYTGAAPSIDMQRVFGVTTFELG